VSDPTTDDQTIRLIEVDPDNPKNIKVNTGGFPLTLVGYNGQASVKLTDRDIQTLAVALHQFAALSMENGDGDMTQRANEVISKLEMLMQPRPMEPDEHMRQHRYELWAAAHDAWFGSTLPDEERLCIVLAVAESHGTVSPVSPEVYLSVRPYDDPTSRQTAAAPVDGGSDPATDDAPQTDQEQAPADDDPYAAIKEVLAAPEGTPVRHEDGWSGTIAGDKFQKDKPTKICVIPNDPGLLGVEAFSARPSDLIILPSNPGSTAG
jgi:hypothetical protein